MILYSNAKINLGLNILERRKDNYHNISSIFYPLYNTYDILEIKPSDYFSLSISGTNVNLTKDNICKQAFLILKERYNIPNVKIHLHKMIPIGAGLGGGSSNGVCMLKGLNKLFNLNITKEKLYEYSLSLGADCPFFIDNTPKYVKGIGDKLSEINLDLSDYLIKIVDPNIYVSTVQAYKLVNPKKPVLEILKIIKKPIIEWKDYLENDFEKPMFNLYPELLEYKNKFYEEGAIYSSMSGSGSVVFGIFKK